MQERNDNTPSIRDGGVMNSLKDQVAIVTGGARGIGRAIAFALAEEKANVMIADLLEDQGRKVAAEIKAGGVDSQFFPVNVTQTEAVEGMVQKIRKDFGRIDILINNAGIGPHPSWCYDTTYNDWHSVLDINLNGTFYFLKAAAGVMKERNYGRVVNISSIAAIHGYATEASYAVSKCGIEGLTFTAAKELGPYGITVNCIEPGIILTEMADTLMKPLEKWMGEWKEKTPVRRFGEPSDVARAVKFLVNPESGFITGATIRVDGGFILQMAPEIALGTLANAYPHRS